MQIRTMSAVFLSAATIVAGMATRADASPFLHRPTFNQSFADTPFGGVDSIENGGGDTWYSDFVLDQFTSSGAWATGGGATAGLVIEGLYVGSIENADIGDSWYSDFLFNQFTLPTVGGGLKKRRFFNVLNGDNRDGGVDHPQDGSVPTPEPGTLLLVATGMAGAAVRRYRKKGSR